jgi:hypothetical protein
MTERNCSEPTTDDEDDGGGGWHTVTSSDKKRVMRKNRRRRHETGVSHPTSASHRIIDDVGTLQKIVQACRLTLQQTALYKQLHRSIEDVSFKEVLCYGIGNFSKTHADYYSPSLWQLACLLQLRDDLNIAVSRQHHSSKNKRHHDHTADKANVYFFDPLCTAFEQDFLISQNIQVLKQDDQGKRNIPIASLIFMPHCPAFLYDNLLAVNPDCLVPGSPTVLIGNSIYNFCDSISLSHPVDALHAKVDLLEEECLQVDVEQPSEFEKAFNDTYVIRGKQK